MIRAFAVLMNLDKASMGVNRNTCLAGPIDRRHLKTLTYGQFYGVIEQRHELHRFSVSLVAANDISIRRKRRSQLSYEPLGSGNSLLARYFDANRGGPVP